MPKAERAEVRPRFGLDRRRLLTLAAPLLSVALALVAGAVFIAAIGERPLEIYALIFRQSFGTGYGLGQTLFRATPLIFTGLAVALGFRAGLFNIGAEGQLYVGGFAAGWIGASLPFLPPTLLVPLCLAAAAGAGAAWASIAGVLKARFGAHEVINTIMLNFIAFGLVAYLGRWVFLPATVRTADIAPGAVLPRLEVWLPFLRGAPASLALVLGLLAAVGLTFWLFQTRRGYEVRAVGLNAMAAEFGGISVGGTHLTALALSGALAGLGATSFVLGYKHYFELGFSSGAGFLGIAVALLGRNHPAGVVIAALFFGALSYGGLVINQRVPKELVEMLQALVILFAISIQALVERRLRKIAG